MPRKVEVTTNEARQATTRPRMMIRVLFGSLFGWVSQWGGSVFHSSHNKTLGEKLALPTPFAWNPNEYLMLLV